MSGFTRAPVCAACLASPRPLEARWICRGCGQGFAGAPPPGEAPACERCRRWPFAFDLARSFGPYEGSLRRLIHLFKYDKMTPLARPLAGHLAGVVAEVGPVDLIVPVPLYRWRRWRRGFNQSALLAKELSRRTGIPSEAGALRRSRQTESQAGLSDQERHGNVRGAFDVPHSARVRGRRVLLVDDVMTTGATLAACTEALQRAGARRVAALTLARAERGSGLDQLGSR